MIYKVTLNGKIYEVEVEKGEAVLQAEYEAALPQAAPVAAAPVASAAPVAAAPAAAPAPAGAASAAAITAPKAGKIGQIYVQKGASVETGAPLVEVL